MCPQTVTLYLKKVFFWKNTLFFFFSCRLGPYTIVFENSWDSSPLLRRGSSYSTGKFKHDWYNSFNFKPDLQSASYRSGLSFADLTGFLFCPSFPQKRESLQSHPQHPNRTGICYSIFNYEMFEMIISPIFSVFPQQIKFSFRQRALQNKPKFSSWIGVVKSFVLLKNWILIVG